MKDIKGDSLIKNRKTRRKAVILLVLAFLFISTVSLIIDRKLNSIRFSFLEEQSNYTISKLYDTIGHIQVDLSNLAIAIGPRNDSLTKSGIDLLRDRAKNSFFNSLIMAYYSFFHELPTDSMLTSWSTMDYITLAEKKVLPIRVRPEQAYGYGMREHTASGNIPIYREVAGAKLAILTWIRFVLILFAFICQGFGMYLLNVPYIGNSKERN